MENVNSVCYINKINKITSIIGADKIELATVNGWTSVVQKGIHKDGDLILCITTDAIIPGELADKWGITSYLRKGNRVRTVKLKGVYSECILIPLKELGLNNQDSHIEGIDMMSQLNIHKYEPPIKIIVDSGGRKHKYHQNPNFNIYYKFPNAKNVPNMFKEGDDVVITRKLHGTNARYGIVKKTKLSLLDKIKKFFGNKFVEYEYVYGSHNVEKGSDSQGFYSTDVWRTIADKYNIKQILWDHVKAIIINDIQVTNFIIYGEIYGPGIQGKNYHYNLKDIDFAVFDIEFNNEYFDHNCTHNFTFTKNLNHVPVLYDGLYNKSIEDKFVYNQFIMGTNIPEEGIVVKSSDGDRKKIYKVINPDYLIYSEKHLVPDNH